MSATFLFWALLGALIGISAARRKGFSTTAGVIGGILLGPLAVLMYAVSGVSRGEQNRKCPFCAEWIKAEATVCRFCHRDLPAAARSVSPSAKQSGRDAWKEYEAWKAGGEVGPSPLPPPRAKTVADAHPWRTLGLAVLITLVICIVLAIATRPKSLPERAASVPTAAPTHYVVIAKAGCRIRTGPGDKYPLVRKASRGEALEFVVGKGVGSWYKLIPTTEGPERWVHSDDVETQAE